MIKNPLINAGAAAAYIGAVVLFISQMPGPDPDTLLLPMAMLSLLVLSVLAMSYFFFLIPFQLYFEGKKAEAVEFFGKTVLSFAGIVVVLLAVLWWFFFR